MSFRWGGSSGDRIVLAEEIAFINRLDSSCLATTKKSRKGAAMREETGEVARNHIIQSCIKAWRWFAFSDSCFYDIYKEDRLERETIQRLLT